MGIDYNRNARVKRSLSRFPGETAMPKAYMVATYRSIRKREALAA